MSEDASKVKVRPSYLADRVVSLKPSGIRKFFDIVAGQGFQKIHRQRRELAGTSSCPWAARNPKMPVAVTKSPEGDLWPSGLKGA